MKNNDFDILFEEVLDEFEKAVVKVKTSTHFEPCSGEEMVRKLKEDAHTAMNAAWTLSWLSKPDKITYLSCHHHALIDFAMRDDIKCRRGLILAILLDMPDAEEPRTDFLDYCLNEFANEQQHDSCRSSMIKMAARMCAPYQELREELRQRLEILPPGLPPSISSAKRKALSTSCRRKRNKNR